MNLQQELFNKYFIFNNEVVSQISKLKEYLPETKTKIVEKKKNLKNCKNDYNLIVHLENINLLEKLNLLEKQSDRTNKASNSDSFIDDKGKISYIEELENSSSLIKNSNTNRGNNNLPLKLSILKYNEYGNDNSINISSVLNENIQLKEKYEHNHINRQRMKIIKDELDRILIKCGNINADNINACKIYSMGVHEISMELLNVHESQLDRINGKFICLYHNRSRK